MYLKGFLSANVSFIVLLQFCQLRNLNPRALLPPLYLHPSPTTGPTLYLSGTLGVQLILDSFIKVIHHVHLLDFHILIVLQNQMQGDMWRVMLYPYHKQLTILLLVAILHFTSQLPYPRRGKVYGTNIGNKGRYLVKGSYQQSQVSIG